MGAWKCHCRRGARLRNLADSVFSCHLPNDWWDSHASQKDFAATRHRSVRFHFRRNRGLAGGLSEGLLEGAPGEHGAFDALWKFSDALKQLKIPKAFRLRRVFT